MPDPTDVMVKPAQTVPSFCLPALPYQPTNPKSYHPAMLYPTDVMAKPPQTLPSFCLPALPYQPTNPKSYHPAIGVIGCGGITTHHLRAYVAAGYRVTALCDVVLEAAERRRDEFYPE